MNFGLNSTEMVSVMGREAFILNVGAAVNMIPVKFLHVFAYFSRRKKRVALVVGTCTEQI